MVLHMCIHQSLSSLCLQIGIDHIGKLSSDADLGQRLMLHMLARRILIIWNMDHPLWCALSNLLGVRKQTTPVNLSTYASSSSDILEPSAVAMSNLVVNKLVRWTLLLVECV
jgi:hypothetical protein